MKSIIDDSDDDSNAELDDDDDEIDVMIIHIFKLVCIIYDTKTIVLPPPINYK